MQRRHHEACCPHHIGLHSLHLQPAGPSSSVWSPHKQTYMYISNTKTVSLLLVFTKKCRFGFICMCPPLGWEQCFYVYWFVAYFGSPFNYCQLIPYLTVKDVSYTFFF